VDVPKFLTVISQLAEQAGQEAMLVGGGVRDLLMGFELADYDLLCTKSAIALAIFLQEHGYASLRAKHEPFGTAKVELNEPSKISIDLATCRAETYDYPGALPKTTYPVSLEQDLKRRDFTINAITLNIKTGKRFDPFGGEEDIANKVIKVLHPKSYWEDPTRIIRAVRFMSRFGFTINTQDVAQIEEAFKDERLTALIKQVRGARVGIELKRLLELPTWLEAAALLEELNGWSLCRAGLKLNLQEPEISLNNWEARLLWLLWNNEQMFEICREIGLAKSALKEAEQIKKLLQIIPEPSLKLHAQIANLKDNYKNLLFALLPSYRSLFLKMSQAVPVGATDGLLQKGLKGKEIAQALETMFKKNIESI
jgi:tRNA nucleotidyltransferase (CCA-adding enzyme)